MKMDRRKFVVGAGLLAATAPLASVGQAKELSMFGLINKIMAAEGKRDALITILLAGTQDMPGCISYVISKDGADANLIWVHEVWKSKADHEASLQLPAVQAAIMEGRPMIAGMEPVAATVPVGGHGLEQ